MARHLVFGSGRSLDGICRVAFDGVNVIFAGDMAQLRPVNGTALYSHSVVNNLSKCTFETVKGQRRLFGTFLWRSLTHVVQLVQNERSKADPEFVEMLGCLRLGSASTAATSTPSDSLAVSSAKASPRTI